MNYLSTLVNRSFPNNKFLKGASIIAGGTAIGQALTVVSSPLLTRMYTPEDFGVLAVFTSLLLMFLVVASLRYEVAIPLPEDDSTAANLLALAMLILFSLSILLGVTCYLGSNLFTSLTNSPHIGRYLWLLPIGLLAGSSYNALSYWTSRKKDFSTLSYTKVLQASGQVAFQVAAGFMHAGPLGLIIGLVVGRFLGVGTLWRRACLPKKAINKAALVEALTTYRHFPLYNSLSALINVSGWQVPSLIIAGSFTIIDAGFFSLTTRIMLLPSSLVGQAVAQVFYPTAAKLTDDKEAAKFIKKVATGLLLAAAPIFGSIALAGPELFGLVFGSKWCVSGTYAQILAPWLLFSFVSSPLSSFVLVKGRQRQALLFTVYETLLRLGTLIGGSYYSLSHGVTFYSVSGVIISLVYINWILRLAGSSLLDWVGNIKFFLGSFITIVMLLLLLKGFLHLSVVLIVFALVISAIGYYTSKTMKWNH